MRFKRCLSASERPTSAVKNETKAVRSLTKSIKSVMGITSHQMEGVARHMELPPTIPVLSKRSYICEYLFVFQKIVARARRRNSSFAVPELVAELPPTFFELFGHAASSV